MRYNDIVSCYIPVLSHPTHSKRHTLITLITCLLVATALSIEAGMLDVGSRLK